MTQYNRMVDVVNSLQRSRVAGQEIVSEISSGVIRHTVLRRPRMNEFPWALLQFGWTLGTPGDVVIKSGAVIKREYSPLVVPETTIAIGTSPTYIGVRVSRDMSFASIISGTSEPVTDSTDCRFWFYIFQNNGGVVQLIGVNLGQIMNVDITAYGD